VFHVIFVSATVGLLRIKVAILVR